MAASTKAQPLPPEIAGSRMLDRQADDLIGRANGEIIAGPLSHHAKLCYPRGEGLSGPVADLRFIRPQCWTVDEYRTLTEALWRREADLLKARDLFAVMQPAVMQAIAYRHLMDGKPLRAGDVTALHGALLTGLSPNTYAMAKKWQRLMDCVGKPSPRCQFKGY
jgi:hypothetical protein